MSTNFPTNLDTYADKTSSDLITSATQNNIQDAIEALQGKVGINSSAVATSLDYLVKSASSSDPGHKHTLANSATDVTATATEINNACDGVVHRASLITITDGGASNTIKVTMASRYNGDAFAITADIARGATVGAVTLQATNGYYFDIADSALTGSCLGVLACTAVTGVPFNSAGDTTCSFDASMSSGGIRITGYRGGDTGAIDAIMDDTGNVTSIALLVHYVTNA